MLLKRQKKKLYYIGNLPESRVPTVAIVGTRHVATAREVTYRLSYDLVQVVELFAVSGLALGVDAWLHIKQYRVGGTHPGGTSPLPAIYPNY